MADLEHVLVTGGAGFIGSHAVDLLLERGVQVRVLDNLSSGHLENLPGSHVKLEFVKGDIREPRAVKAAMQGISHCLHLAAQVSVESSVQDPANSAHDNILGFINVLHAAHEGEVQRLVYASSAAVYGNPAYLPLDEQAPLKPISPYGLEKYVDEQYADLYASVYGMSCLGLRYFNVYGPRQDPASSYAGVISLFIDRLRSGRKLRVFGDGKQTRDFIYVGDIAQANVAALQGELTGACNVATGEKTSLLHLVGILCSLLADTGLEHLPAREGDILHSVADASRMFAGLGVQGKTTLSEGLAELLRFSDRVLEEDLPA